MVKFIKAVAAFFFLLFAMALCSTAMHQGNPQESAQTASGGESQLHKMLADHPKEAPAQRQYISESCSQVARKFSVGDMTELQRKTMWGQYDNRWVKWSGTVGEVSETFGKLNVHVRCRSGTMGSDVLVGFDDRWRQRLVQLRPGQRISFEARLTDYNSFIALDAEDGELLDHPPLRLKGDGADSCPNQSDLIASERARAANGGKASYAQGAADGAAGCEIISNDDGPQLVESQGLFSLILVRGTKLWVRSANIAK